MILLDQGLDAQLNVDAEGCNREVKMFLSNWFGFGLVIKII
jgi:hypothetical protein